MDIDIEDISNESSCDHCGSDIHGEPPFCEENTGLIFCSRDCFINGRDSKKYWILKSADQPVTSITFVRQSGGIFQFTDEDGVLVEKFGGFFNDLDFVHDEGMDGDPGDIGDWWINTLFSTKEKALKARRFAFEQAIGSLKMRIEASKMQIKEDKEQIEKLRNQMNEVN